jgi:hypothetical protein
MEGREQKSSRIAESAKSPRVQRFFELVTLSEWPRKVNRTSSQLGATTLCFSRVFPSNDK